ncbi:hypothetical protein CDIK_3291 [Cucumispora dikerogammari]|nr:hypothetical protein CDIK_3291 [Cucumispora dikerogammari]
MAYEVVNLTLKIRKAFQKINAATEIKELMTRTKIEIMENIHQATMNALQVVSCFITTCNNLLYKNIVRMKQKLENILNENKCLCKTNQTCSFQNFILRKSFRKRYYSSRIEQTEDTPCKRATGLHYNKLFFLTSKRKKNKEHRLLKSL